MAKTKPAADDAVTASGDALALVEAPAIDAAPIAAPENTPVPGGGRWSWDYSAARWVDKDAPAAPTPDLIQPE